MENKNYSQTLVDLSDLDTEVPLSKNEEHHTQTDFFAQGKSMITKDSDLIDIFSDEIQQKRIEAQKKEEMLKEEEKKEEKQEDPKTQSCLSIEYYKQYYQIDSKLFMHRFLSSLWPFTSQPFLHPSEQSDISLPPPAQPIVDANKQDYSNRYDLYGALWIPTTLILVLTLCSYSLHNDNEHLNRLVSITYVTYIFLLAFPLVLFAVVRLGLVGEDINERSLKNKIGFYILLCVYGYSFTPYLVPALLSMFRYVILKWSLIFVATFTSLWMLNKEVGVLAAQNEDQKKKGVWALRGLVTAAQLGYGCLMGFWFLST